MRAHHSFSATELALYFRAGELTPVDVCEQLLDRIDALDPTLNAFRLMCGERAMQAAEAATAQISQGIDLGPLHGIPYVTKDLFDVAGLVTTAGSRVHADRIANADATVTHKLAAAGAVLLGKTNTVEFAFGGIGINHSHGTPHNPWSEEHRVPGGSSSGSAVAVAAQMTPLATGTDTACSVRTPAALCGVVGLKTTVGRVSRAGVYPLSSTLDSVGPLTRSVEDAALMFDVIQGSDPGDPSTLGVDRIDVIRSLRDGARGLRVGIAEGLMFEGLDPEVEKAVRAAAELFRALGAAVTTVDFTEAGEVMARPSVVSVVEGYAVNAQYLENRFEELDPVVRERMLPGGEVRAVDYRRALDDLVPVRKRAERRFDGVDVLLAPTTRIPAATVAEVDQDFDTYMEFGGKYLRNCFVGNLLRLCGISLPCGFTTAGLPIGLMLYGAPMREDLVLRAAYAYEQATTTDRREPDLSWVRG